MWLILLGLPLLAFFVTYKLVRRIARGRHRRPSPRSVDGWIGREVSRIASQRLGLSQDVVERTVTGNPDPDVVQSLERGVAKVDVAYERVPGRGDREADVRVEVTFEGGAVDRSLTRVAWAELADDVRRELDRTGASQVFRPWKFSWRS